MSLETQTRTTGANITALLRTWTHINACWISFAQEKKKNMDIFIFQALQNGIKNTQIRENLWCWGAHCKTRPRRRLPITPLINSGTQMMQSTAGRLGSFIAGNERRRFFDYDDVMTCNCGAVPFPIVLLAELVPPSFAAWKSIWTHSTDLAFPFS